MKKNQFRALALSAVALLGTAAMSAEQQQLVLTFDRTGTNPTAVSVNSSVTGITASLTSASHDWKTGGVIGNNILCPNINANAGADETVAFSIAGLPANASITGISLDIHALNGSSAYQDASGAAPRQWNVDFSINGANFVSLTDIDIAKNVNASSGTRNKIWDFTPAAPASATDPLSLNLHFTKGTSNDGCFFGFKEIIINYDVTETDPEPAVPAAGSVDFDIMKSTYGLPFALDTYLTAGTIIKDGPISIIFDNKKVQAKNASNNRRYLSFESTALLVFVPDAGYKITSVKYTYTNTSGTVEDRNSKFTNNGDNTWTKISGTHSVQNIIVEYEPDPESIVANVAVANAFTAAISNTAAYAYNYFVSASHFISEDASKMIYTDLPTALKNYAAQSANFSSVTAVKQYFASEIAKFEDMILAGFKTKLEDPENSFTFKSKGMIDAGKASWISNSLYAVGCDTDLYIANPGSSAGAIFNPVAVGGNPEIFTLRSIIDGITMACASVNDGVVGPKSDSKPNELSFKVVLNNGAVQLVLSGNPSKALGINIENGCVSVLDATDPGTLLYVYSISLSSALSTASSSIYYWGGATPDFTDQTNEYRASVTQLESLSSLPAFIKDVQKTIISKLTATEVNMFIYSFSKKFIGYVDGNLMTNLPTDDAQRWKISLIEDAKYNKVLLYNHSIKKYLTHDCTLVDQPGENCYFALVFENNSSSMSLVVPGKTTDNSLRSNTTDYKLYLDNYSERFANSIGYYTFKFIANPAADPAVVATLNSALTEASQLGALYLSSIPFAGQTARTAIEKTLPEAIAKIDNIAFQFKTADEAAAYVAGEVAKIETALLADLNANIGKEWTLYQPKQKGYLSALTRDPGNKGFVVFDYQSKVDANASWSLVANGTDGQFFMKSAKGQFISTPNVNYCRVADTQPTAPDGVFTLGLKDGYVIFKSANHEGCGLGFDCQNDPVEIMGLNDGSTGYRWQVNLLNLVPDHSVHEAFVAQIDSTKTLCVKYTESLPFASEAINAAIAQLDATLANAEELSKEFNTVEEVEAYFKETMAALEASFAEVIYDKVKAGEAFAIQVASLAGGDKASYFSSSIYAMNHNDGAMLLTKEISAGNLFRIEKDGDDYAIYTLNSNARLAGSTATGNKIAPAGEFFGYEIKFRFKLSDGNVYLTVANGNGKVGLYTAKGTVGVWNADPATTALKLTSYTLAQTAEMANTQLGLWGALMPFGEEITAKVAPEVTAAESIAVIGELMVKAKRAMIDTLIKTDAPIYFKSINTKGYIGFENKWYSDYTEEEASEWTFTPASADITGNYMFSFLLKDETAGQYLTYHGGNSTTPNGNQGSATSDFYAIAFDNPGIITISIPRNNLGNGLTASGDGISFADYGNRYNGDIAPFCFAFVAGEDNSEKIAYIEAKMEDARALAELYRKSVPFAEDGINLICALLEYTTPEAFLEEFESEEQFDEYFQKAMIAPLEEVVLQALNANSDKPWTLFQNIQNAYLSATTKSTNQGYDSFDYQATADDNAAWTLVPAGEEGQYFLKSYKNQYIGTPKVHYCQALDELPAEPNGVFTIGVSEGYVVFYSVAQDGSVLGFDCQNDPVEIMKFGTSPKGYLWQVNITEINNPYDSLTDITVDGAETEIYDLQGRRVFKPGKGLYIVNGKKLLEN